jgi:hypothetical protein
VSATPFDLTAGNIFYLWVQDAQYGGVFGSSYLNFTTTGVIQSLGFTATSSSPTSKPTQSSGTQTSGSGTNLTSGNQSSSGIGTGAIAGIAVVVAVLVIAAVLGWFFWYQRRKRSTAASSIKPEYTDVPPYQAVPHQYTEAFGKPGHVPYEAQGNVAHKPAEMGTYTRGEYQPGGIAELGDSNR